MHREGGRKWEMGRVLAEKLLGRKAREIRPALLESYRQGPPPEDPACRGDTRRTRWADPLGGAFPQDVGKGSGALS